MIYAVTCPDCLHVVGGQPPVKPDDKIMCSHCNALIDAGNGQFIEEPVMPEKEFDLLSTE